MPLASEQYNVVDPPARLFYLNASMLTIPAQGHHRYIGSSAVIAYGAVRLPSGGEWRWHDAEGEYAYIALTIDDGEYDLQPR